MLLFEFVECHKRMQWLGLPKANCLISLRMIWDAGLLSLRWMMITSLCSLLPVVLTTDSPAPAICPSGCNKILGSSELGEGNVMKGDEMVQFPLNASPHSPCSANVLTWPAYRPGSQTDHCKQSGGLEERPQRACHCDPSSYDTHTFHSAGGRRTPDISWQGFFPSLLGPALPGPLDFIRGGFLVWSGGQWNVTWAPEQSLPSEERNLPREQNTAWTQKKHVCRVTEGNF